MVEYKKYSVNIKNEIAQLLEKFLKKRGISKTAAINFILSESEFLTGKKARNEKQRRKE